MESILEKIINHIGENMPFLKEVDEDYGQLEFIDQENKHTYPLTFPAVLVDAPETQWSNIAGLSQKGLTTVRVKLIIDCYDDTHYTSGTTQLIAQREAWRRKLHSLLQGFIIEDGTTLIRTTSRFYTINHGIKVYEATYTTEVTELLKPDRMTIRGVSVRISDK